MKNKTEALLEELTKVSPHELSKDGLKLFNKINEIIDKNKELEKENKRLKGKIDVCDWQEKSCREIIDEKYIPVSLVEEKIEEIKNETWYIDCGVEAKQSCIEILQELLEKRK